MDIERLQEYISKSVKYEKYQSSIKKELFANLIMIQPHGICSK